MTLAERTPPHSPFAILYADRANPDTAKPPAKRGPKPRKSKAKPVAETMRKSATRVNSYADHGRNAPSRSDAIRRGGI